MKITTEISADADEEIIIRCKEVSERVKRLQFALNEALSEKLEMRLTLGGTELFIPYGEILFFETCGRTVAAHTRDGMYYTELKLFELESLLPKYYVRISKSCIVNTKLVRSVSRGISGNGEVGFSVSDKRAYVSRMYYKPLIDRINETRVGYSVPGKETK